MEARNGAPAAAKVEAEDTPLPPSTAPTPNAENGDDAAAQQPDAPADSTPSPPAARPRSREAPSSAGDAQLPAAIRRRSSIRRASAKCDVTKSTLLIDDVRVGDEFRVLEMIGRGAFGDVYRGEHVLTKKKVAVKLSPAGTEKQRQRSLLIDEARVCKLLCPGGPRGVPPDIDSSGVSRVYWYGQQGEFHCLIIDLLGPSLSELFNYCGRRFTINTVLRLGEQMVTRIEYLHSKHLLHNDVKPENFLLGTGQQSGTVFVIDFGLAAPFRDPLTLQHEKYKDGTSFAGTPRFSSRNLHMGIRSSRRDDLESVVLVMLWLMRGGHLPWDNCHIPDGSMLSGVKSMDDGAPMSPKSPMSPVMMRKLQQEQQKLDEVRALERGRDKITYRTGQRMLCTPSAELCRGYPPEIADFYAYCGGLRFSDKPDYEYLRNLCNLAARRDGGVAYEEFDWVRITRERAMARSRLRSQGGSPRHPQPLRLSDDAGGAQAAWATPADEAAARELRPDIVDVRKRGTHSPQDSPSREGATRPPAYPAACAS